MSCFLFFITSYLSWYLLHKHYLKPNHRNSLAICKKHFITSPLTYVTNGIKDLIKCSMKSWVHFDMTRSEMYLRGKSVCSWCDRLSDRSFMVDPLSYFSFQPVLHDWCNKGRGMCYPNQKVAHVAAAGFLSRYLEWSFTI